MPNVHFLSQNGPGPRMGMGHYERLLIQHLITESSHKEWQDQKWQFDFTCDGRALESAIRADISIHPALGSAKSLGVSVVRFEDWPWPIARAIVKGQLKAQHPSRFSRLQVASTIFHSLSLAFPAPDPGIYSIHDLAPLRFSDEGCLPKWSKQAARDARLILTLSESSKREIVELLGVDPNKIAVVPIGWEEERFNMNVPIADVATLATLGIKGSFLLSAGGHSQRKNIPALLEAWKMVAPRHPELTLVLAGSKKLQALVENQCVPRAIALGYVDNDLLPSVMRAARGLIFPSVYEGFGMPPQEAMAMGVPVIASRACEAVLEVVGEVAVLAEDGTPEALSDAIERLICNPDLEAQLRLAGPNQARCFSWPQHARTVLGLYRSVLA